MKLKGKVALITGASRGIGKAIALAMAREGSDIGVNYVEDDAGQNLRQAQAVVEEITSLGTNGVVLQANVADEAEVDGMVESVIKRFGKIDILVNNAGIIRDLTLKKMTRQDWDDVISVNLTGVFDCSKAVINYMREAGFGRIISMSSIIGQTGNIGQCNYAASKAGVMAFTKSLAQEVARRGITVNAIAPGLIETDMFYLIPEEARNVYREKIPAGRFGSTTDIAELAVFLASDEAAYITGQTIHVNGGLYM